MLRTLNETILNLILKLINARIFFFSLGTMHQRLWSCWYMSQGKIDAQRGRSVQMQQRD